MLERIRIRNFQSVSDADLALGPLTFLLGPSMVGKSAVVRAIQAAVTNTAGSYFIRDGADLAEVILTIDGEDLIWRKPRGKGGQYVLNGQEYNRTGGQVPDAVAEWLAIRPIEVESGFSLWPQIQDQMDPPFLLMESGSRRARALGKLTRLDVVITAQMRCRTELQRAEREATRWAEEGEHLQRQLEASPDPTETLARLEEWFRDWENFVKDTERFIQVQAILERRREAESALQLDPRPHLTAARMQMGAIEAVLVVDASHQARQKALVQETAQAQEQLEAIQEYGLAQQAYDEACEAEAVCDRCPWR